MKVVESRSPEREVLARAIASLAQAESDLQAARGAVTSALERTWDAQDRLGALREEHRSATDGPAGVFIAAMQGGRQASAAELEAPSKTREAAEADIQREIEALRMTRAALDTEVVERAEVLSRAKLTLDGAVAEVLRSELDVATLLAEAEAATADIIARRCALIQLQSLLPASEEKAAIDRFLARLFLRAEREFACHPAAQALAAAAEALKRDADAALRE
jgi:hypothetical protein